MKHPYLKRGITLTQVLFVLGMLMVLLALTISVFEQAKLAPRSAVCKSYGKQISTALLMYMQDYGERFPAHVDGQHHTLPAQLHPYIKSQEVWRCPEAPKELTYDGTPGDTTVSFGYNWRALEERGRGIKQSALKNPALTVAFAESTSYLTAPAFLTGTEATPPRYAHRKLANVFFADGHAKALTQEELEKRSGTEGGRGLGSDIDAFEYWNRR